MDERDPQEEPPRRRIAPAADPAQLAAMGIIQVGDLLSTSARAVGSNFGTFFVIALAVTLPGSALEIMNQEWQAWQASVPLPPDAPFDEPTFAPLIVLARQFSVALLKVVLQFLAQAALMYATVEFMAGRRAGVGASLSAGFRSAGPVIGLSILNTLAIGFGTMACIVPGIVLTCVLYASVPSAVVERLGPIAAMQRSAELTTGHRGTIFLALLAVYGVYLTFFCTVFFFIGVSAAESGMLSAPARIASYAISIPMEILLTIFTAALAAVFYARARGVHDGVDADAIARVFE